MLSLTEDAATLIRDLVEDADLPATAGLRLATDPQRGSLAMSLAPRPWERDVVVARSGAAVFLSPGAARRLRGATLRAQVERRRAFFLD